MPEETGRIFFGCLLQGVYFLLFAQCMACESSSAATQSLAFAVALLSRGLEMRPLLQDLWAIDGVPASALG
jgi:hypothetical protein